MARVDLGAFTAAYRRAVEDVGPLLTRERQALIARHNLGLHPDRFDLLAYLRASERRYVAAVQRFNEHHAPGEERVSALDVGGFLGAFPLALARLGVEVTLAEEYDYYHGAFDELKDVLEREGISVWSVDFTQPLPEAPPRRFSLVTNMAMLEHLPSTPRQLMDNLHTAVADGGILIAEVPNIAYWPTRLRALRGQSIHQAYDLYYASEPPWLGHHREYTVDEMRQLLDWSDFEILALDLHNYSLSLRSGAMRERLFTLAVHLWPTLVSRRCREVIMAVARPRRPRTLPPRPDALRLLGPGHPPA